MLDEIGLKDMCRLYVKRVEGWARKDYGMDSGPIGVYKIRSAGGRSSNWTAEQGFPVYGTEPEAGIATGIGKTHRRWKKNIREDASSYPNVDFYSGK